MQILSMLKAKSTSTSVKDFMIVCGGALLLFAASQIAIPLHPVPITLQTVGVMLIGLTYSSRHALQATLLWLGLAAAGAPVLSGLAGGITCFAGTNAGYLLGFLVSAYLMAILKEKFTLNSWKSDALLCALGTVIVFVMGVSWLSYLIGFQNALLHGFFPFIIPGFIKAGLLCTALQILRRYRMK